MTLMTPQVCQTDDGVCFAVETARPLFDVFHGPPPLESARKLIEAHDDLVTLAVCTYEDQRILRDFPGGFPRLETLGYMDSGMSHDLFRHLFFKIRTTMPKLKALAVSTDTVDYDADGWDVFAAVPETIRDVYLEFDCCLDALTRNSIQTADHIAKFLPPLPVRTFDPNIVLGPRMSAPVRAGGTSLDGKKERWPKIAENIRLN